MNWNNITLTIVFLSLAGPGIVGNILVFVRYVHNSALGTEKKPLDLILIHLAFSNLIIICSTGIRDLATVFSFRNFLGDIGCKAAVYLARMARGLSICTTCLLSMVQVVTISPRTSFLRKFRPQTIWQVLPSLLLLCIFNVLISSNLLHHITVGSSLNRSRAGVYYEYCYMLPSRYTVKW
ncbi:hypothetical protein FDP47_13250, partial [Enterococcus faecium]|nr:hypothetical protein [Enterococcus faecium]